MDHRLVVVSIEAEVRPSESGEKVEKALRNVIGPIQLSLEVEKREAFIRIRAESEKALARVYQQVRNRQIVAVARRLLIENMSGARTWAYLNRQAAYSGVVAFCESPEESPVGPVTLTLESEDLSALLDWLVPE